MPDTTNISTCSRPGCDEAFDQTALPSGCVAVEGSTDQRCFCSHACLDWWLHYSEPEELAQIFAGRYVPPSQQAQSDAARTRDARVEEARKIMTGETPA